MNIVYGLLPGMVIGRTGELCRGRFVADADGDVAVEGFHARIEEDGVEDGHRVFWLTGIPIGGPYTVTLTDDQGAVTVDNLYVGDVWLLGGQSNMEGVGYYRDIAAGVRVFPFWRQFSFDNAHWEPAEPRMHRGWLNPHPFMTRHFAGHGGVQERGVGPGYYFARAMYRRTGVPQGVIPCALGGSNMGDWDPEAPDKLYAMTIERFRLSGSHVAGIFWYQGCSDANPDAAARFTERMIALVDAFRRDCGDPALPFVQVQIGRFTNTPLTEDAVWSAIREHQRRLSEKIDRLDTVAVTDADYADGIHLQAGYHERLGENAAESMYRLCFDPRGLRSLPAPALASIRAIDDPDTFGETLAVTFDHVHGDLRSPGVPAGFALSRVPDQIDTMSIFRIELMGGRALIYHEVPRDQLGEMYLSYYFGNGRYANITDAAGRPLPAFGPLKLADWLEQ
ncbi:MAG: sialate O-acetylesterase [Acutalibacteraceae bacterium]|jgi:hypothetical protein